MFFCRQGVKRHQYGSELHPVVLAETRLADPDTVDIGTVGAAEVFDADAVAIHAEQGVLSRDLAYREVDGVGRVGADRVLALFQDEHPWLAVQIAVETEHTGRRVRARYHLPSCDDCTAT